ncbi:QN1 [Mytilus edulis]|uniref:Centrosomal protein of 162 kDa n=1 Tax=Mytilus edulis TaxID=6550 RepID=A0A8S3RL49_MYTED|nr:QN1 [Mytilus edulis]
MLRFGIGDYKFEFLKGFVIKRDKLILHVGDNQIEKLYSVSHGNKVTVKVMIKHLKEQLNKSHLDSEQLSILRIQNASLENQIDKLKEELREAKKFHTPEMKHFESIQQKIIQMEKKRETRELELQQIIKNAKHTASVEMDQEVNKWKGIVDSKNSEIQRFRTELDSILDVLKLLQKQGVVIPVSAAVS